MTSALPWLLCLSSVIPSLLVVEQHGGAVVVLAAAVRGGSP
jgi:hypothetical protein